MFKNISQKDMFWMEEDIYIPLASLYNVGMEKNARLAKPKTDPEGKAYDEDYRKDGAKGGGSLSS